MKKDQYDQTQMNKLNIFWHFFNKKSIMGRVIKSCQANIEQRGQVNHMLHLLQYDKFIYAF